MTDPLDLEVRKKIYAIIRRYPGIHLRELQRRTGLATGTLDYHLHFLRKNTMIRIDRIGRFTRYYDSRTGFDEQEKKMLSLLRQKTLRRILLFMLGRKTATATEIAEGCGLTPSALSPHLRTLEAHDVLTHRQQGRYRFYTIENEKRIVAALMAHRKSFLDRMVDSFIETWTEEL